MRLRVWIGMGILAGAGTVAAFNPPVDRRDGVTLSIEGFPDDSDDQRVALRKVPAGQPLEITVTLKNERPEAVDGNLAVWLNDDWEVQGKASVPLRAEAGATVTARVAAVAKPTVLDALYPVHARFSSGPAGRGCELHAIAMFEAARQDVRLAVVEAREAVPAVGVLRLDRGVDRRVYVARGGEVKELGVNFNGSDAATGTTVQCATVTRGGVARAGFGVHPPYRGGAGATWSEFKLALPAGERAALTFHTALRDHTAAEPPSDGTEFKVLAIDEAGGEEVLFERFSAGKEWQAARVDLGAHAGRRITLRLWTGPGPMNNTTCDHCYWGDPMIVIGTPPAPPGEDEWRTRERQAGDLALALARRLPVKEPGGFLLEVGGRPFAAAVAPGEQGLTDAVIAFSDGVRVVSFRGFACEVDGALVGGVENGPPVQRVERRSEHGQVVLLHHVAVTGRDCRGRELVVRARIRSDGAALRIGWDMPGVERDARGGPRFTRLGLGAGSEPVRRAYAGFGNVIEEPGPFVLTAGGFNLSTRHVGADYPNGLSLLQACDVFPDRLVWAPGERRFALETQHDAEFLFVPAADGAFAAARAYRDLCGFEKGPGVDQLLGRMCLDQWGGDFGEAAAGVAEAARYGLNHAVFVKHVWQRWGYDYRLPEIYPPAGGLEPFLALREAARGAGMLFCPHDNYIDFYPDAAGFSYDHIVFSEDGRPVRAWYNRGRRAQSYRWLPHAFRPWLEPNLRAMRDGFRPDSLFIDVFTAIPPFDYFDRAGSFHPRTRTAREWRAAFDTCRGILGGAAPMLSEAGTDALIGSVDGAQADHFPAQRWLESFGLADRTPWHDMATHGRMVLFAGGLGHRYSALDWDDHDGRAEHGYGSDDYLSNTVLGGRNPMCDGPFSRRAVMTYWLLHDVCDALARESFEGHRFGPTIQQQHTTFGGGGKVWANRGAGEPWTVADGKVLPEFGFHAETSRARAGVFLIDGQRAGFARSPQAVFADARPVHGPLRGKQGEPAVNTARKMLDFGPLVTDGAFRLLHGEPGAWQLIPLPGSRPFRAELRLAELGAAGAKVRGVEMVEPHQAAARPPAWRQEGDTLLLECDGQAFAYRIGMVAGDR